MKVPARQTPTVVAGYLQESNDWKVINMTGLVVIIAIIAIALIFFGGFVQAVQWLLWVGIVLLVIAVIVWLLRSISGRRNTSV